MSGRDAPPWLAALQGRFGEALRTPLDRSAGRLRATPDAYDPGAVADVVDGPRAAAAERLAVYNRQYWFRLFGVVQTAFPLTARLLGHWHLNDHAGRFFLAHPPRGWDVDRAPDGFEDFLQGSLGEHPAREALLEAARLAAAWRALFRAPAVAPFAPDPSDAARLPDARLAPSPAAAVFVERWPLLALKRALAAAPGESAVPLPARLPQPRAWALLRESAGIRHLALEPREAELLVLLRRHTVRDALAALEASCPEAERSSLPGDARRWLAQGVARGMWVGLVDEAHGTTQVNPVQVLSPAQLCSVRVSVSES